MYTVVNFKTKKALKEAVDLRLRWLAATAHPTESAERTASFPNGEPEPITFWQRNNMFGITSPDTGVVTIEGPHFPQPHRWYARCTIEEGEVVKVS